MAITHPSRGFALLVSVIFMAVMLAIGVAFASLGYKQILLSASTAGSGQAFYVADAALECALYTDRKTGNPFDYSGYHDPLDPLFTPDVAITCGASVSISNRCYKSSGCSNKYLLEERADFGATCADVTIEKRSDGTTFLYSQGYNAPCSVVDSASGTHVVARGLYATY